MTFTWRPFVIKAVLFALGIGLIIEGVWPVGVLCLLAVLLEYD